MSFVVGGIFLTVFSHVSGQFVNTWYPPCVPEWHYWGWLGQDHWCCRGFPLCCGWKQSPINIEIYRAKYDHLAECLSMHNYEITPKAMALHNNGWHAELLYNAWNSSTIPHVMLGNVRNGTRYELDRVIFHWGNTSKFGSDHTLDRVQMPMEMQMIHRNTKYSSLAEAMNRTDGLLIISVLFVVVPEDNNNLRHIIYNLKYIHWKHSWHCITPFPFLLLLPPSYGYYYTYHGSLPFPPCYESVRWIVFHNPVYISEFQLNQFREIQDETRERCPDYSCPMWNNYRKPICVKDRDLRWKEECAPDPRC